MLQNELFQREVRAMFGEDFVRQAASGNAAGIFLKHKTNRSVRFSYVFL